jgi:fatty-acyl-CoA synthase
MGALLLSAIARYPTSIALADDRCQLTYKELEQEIARAVAVLKDAGLRAGEGIAILCANRVELFIVEAAAMLIGARYTPLHPMAGAETHAFVIQDAEIRVLVVDPETLSYPLDRLTAPIILALGPLDGARDLLAAMRSAQPAPLVDEAEATGLVRLLYTGGTTGQPKGVMLSHRAMIATTLIQASEWDLPPRPRFLAVTPISHASGAVIPTILMRGGYVRLTAGFAVERFCRIVADEAIDTTFLVPTMIYVLLDDSAAQAADLSALATIVYGASPIAPERLTQALQRFGLVFVQLYGQTEVPNAITALKKGDHDPHDPARLKSCGLPTSLVTLSLRDAENRPVAEGQPGEICVRGPVVCEGYWNAPELTAKAFAGGWLHTGDIAVCAADGFYAIVDRTSDLIISGGFNVYPSEVEDVLTAHPAVALAAVVGLPDPKWGEAVTAFVTLKPDCSVEPAALQALVRAERGAVWTPKSVHIVDRIPLTPLGKIDRKALRARPSK